MPRLLQRVRDYCANPQDLVASDDVASLLQIEFGLPDGDSRRLVEWLVESGYLRRRPHVHVDGDAIVSREVLRHGPRFGG